MLTTLQVRAIIRKHIQTNIWNTIWTNKPSKNCGDRRTVKVYFNGAATHPMIRELRRAGVDLDDMNFTAGSQYLGAAGLTVRCVLPK
jgi:hypothetical protein